MPGPGPGVCLICRGPDAAATSAVCFACRSVARRLGLPLAPVVPVRLCPLPEPALHASCSATRSRRWPRPGCASAPWCARWCAEFLLRHAGLLEATAGGPLDLVLLVPSTRRPGTSPLGRGGRPRPGRRRRPAGGALGAGTAATGRGSGRAAARRAHAARPAAFRLRRERPVRRDRHARVLLLDDTYVSGARSQSAAAALQLAGACATLIVPLGRVLRPDRVRLPRRLPPPARRPEARSSDRGAHRVAHAGQLLGRLPERRPPPAGRGHGATGAPTRGGPYSPHRCAGPMYWPEPDRRRGGGAQDRQGTARRRLPERGPGGPPELAPQAAGARAPRRSRPGCSGSSRGARPARGWGARPPPGAGSARR